MDEGLQPDMALFGVAVAPVYDGLGQGSRDVDVVADVFLDLKAEAPADPAGEVQAMLSAMTKELRERFQRFQSQRQAAEAEAGLAGDETARKAAQADAKAAIEAVSLIVRTLEKIDSLQRTIAHERRQAAESEDSDEDDAALAAEFDRLVEARARERYEAWKRDFERVLAAGDRAEAAPGGDGCNGP